MHDRGETGWCWVGAGPPVAGVRYLSFSFLAGSLWWVTVAVFVITAALLGSNLFRLGVGQHRRGHDDGQGHHCRGMIVFTGRARLCCQLPALWLLLTLGLLVIAAALPVPPGLCLPRAAKRWKADDSPACAAASLGCGVGCCGAPPLPARLRAAPRSVVHSSGRRAGVKLDLWVDDANVCCVFHIWPTA